MDQVEFARVRLLKMWSDYEAAGGKQVSFAAAAGITQGTLSTWIMKLRAGDVPKLESIQALCKGFGIPLSSLFASSADASPSLSPTAVLIISRLPSLDEEKLKMVIEFLDDIQPLSEAGQKDLKSS